MQLRQRTDRVDDLVAKEARRSAGTMRADWASRSLKSSGPYTSLRKNCVAGPNLGLSSRST